MSDLPERVEVLEEHVLGQALDKPGLLMRLDRQERQLAVILEIVKFMVLGGGIATIWKIADFAITLKAGAQP